MVKNVFPFSTRFELLVTSDSLDGETFISWLLQIICGYQWKGNIIKVKFNIDIFVIKWVYVDIIMGILLVTFPFVENKSVT